MPLSLSIIIPAYNESERIGKTLRDILAYLDEQPAESELIVVDDGSKDDTARVSEEIFSSGERGKVEARVIRYEQNRGKGYAVRTGLLAARAPIALFSDADLSTPITETPKVVAPIRSGEYDLIFGSRALDRGLIGVHQSWRREQGGRVFNMIVRLATRLPFWDTQCGFKAFRMDVCRPIIEAAKIDRFGFDVELIYVAHLAGLRVREWPVRWDHNEGGKVDYFSDSFKMVNEVRAIRRLAREGFYDEAIKKARDIAAQAPNRLPFTTGEPEDLPESDVSPEVARQRIEIRG
ncbi:MAG: glycosyltransferase family 2 protein [Acidobacteria bacterium]|nr:glycosyltransferase family 2 protein [Acidobacteriota bacterium]